MDDKGEGGDQPGDTGPGESNGGGEKMSDARHYFKGRSNKIYEELDMGCETKRGQG